MLDKFVWKPVQSIPVLDDRNIYDLTPIFGKKTVVSCRFCLIDPAAFYSAELYSYSECKSLSITLPVNRLNPLWSQPSTQDLNIQPFSTSDHFSIIRVLFGEMTSRAVAGCPQLLDVVRIAFGCQAFWKVFGQVSV